MDTVPSLLFNNDIIDTQLQAFCASDPEYVRLKQKFYDTAQEIARQVGSSLYDTFERDFGLYLYRTADLYYLFGLSLRQEILQAFKE